MGAGVAVTGDAAIQHDVGALLARDLRVGELYLAVPAALAILFAVFGTASALLPFVFAAETIAPALGVARAAAHVLQLSDYLRNMVAMIGLGIAIDYSLLVVNRYRDERRRGRPHAGAVTETMTHAGRTIVFSGLAASVGLALMLLLPVPFLQGFGLGGLLVPLLSIGCAVTLLPVLLSAFGESLERITRRLVEERHPLLNGPRRTAFSAACSSSTGDLGRSTACAARVVPTRPVRRRGSGGSARSGRLRSRPVSAVQSPDAAGTGVPRPPSSCSTASRR